MQPVLAIFIAKVVKNLHFFRTFAQKFASTRAMNRTFILYALSAIMFAGCQMKGVRSKHPSPLTLHQFNNQ